MNHYRGKYVSTKEWIYGGISHIPKYNQYFINIVQNESYLASIEVEPESIGQYTGLEVNNIKLYDKQSFKVYNKIYKVVWNEKDLCWSAISEESKERFSLSAFIEFSKDEIEIIQD
jgi:hypothetical protein